MTVYADWLIVLAVGWVVELPEFSLIKRESVGEPLALVEADDFSLVVDLAGKGKLRAGEIKRREIAVLHHEPMYRRIDIRGSIVANDDAVPVDSGYVCFSGTGKPEDVKGPIVQKVSFGYAVSGN